MQDMQFYGPEDPDAIEEEELPSWLPEIESASWKDREPLVRAFALEGISDVASLVSDLYLGGEENRRSIERINGISRPLETSRQYQLLAHSDNYQYGEGKWIFPFELEGAELLRLGLEDIDLPPSAHLYVRGSEGEAIPVPLDLVSHGGVQWFPTVPGPIAYLAIQVDSEAISGAQWGFRPAALLQIFSTHSLANYPKIRVGQWAGDLARVPTPSPNSHTIQRWCQENLDLLSRAAAGYHFVPDLKVGLGAERCSISLLGSGALLNNCSRPKAPFFLTAHHVLVPGDCPESQLWPQVYQSFEAFWDYQKDSGKKLLVTRGASVIVGDRATDAALLLLWKLPDSGLSRAFLGWSSDTEGTLYRVSHPLGGEQHLSVHQVAQLSSSASYPQTCPAHQSADFLFTESPHYLAEGSSGSALVNEELQIVGQLWGSRYQDGRRWMIDGRFSSFFKRISCLLCAQDVPWLDPLKPKEY